MLAFVGAAAFCVLSLLTPDSALLGGSDKVNVPLAGPVSFVGFIIIGPAVLVVLRVYLEIYIEHGKRLARVARLVPAHATLEGERQIAGALQGANVDGARAAVLDCVEVLAAT